MAFLRHLLVAQATDDGLGLLLCVATWCASQDSGLYIAALAVLSSFAEIHWVATFIVGLSTLRWLCSLWLLHCPCVMVSLVLGALSTSCSSCTECGLVGFAPCWVLWG